MSSSTSHETPDSTESASVTHPTICRYCPAHCGVLATVEHGRLVKVAGDPDNPLFAGYTCQKGRALPDQHNHPGRLLSSVVRGDDGIHRPIEVETAMDEIALKVAAIVAEHGPRSVALYVGTNALPYAISPGFAHAWLRGIGSPMFFTSNTIDQPGKQLATALHGMWLAGEHTFETSDAWLLVGLNPVIAKSSGVPIYNPALRLKEARARGLKLVVIDPRLTETAKFAHIHLQPRPGEDPTILAGLLHVIFAEGLEDASFLADEAVGVEVLREKVAPFTPDYVARRADVPREDLIEAARVLANAKRAGASCGTGPSMATRGTLSEYLSRALNTVCGRWARAGEKVAKPNVLLPPFEAKAQPLPPYKAWGYGEKLRVRGLTDAACGMPTAALADEILLEGEGQVKALVCLGGNPMMAWPDQEKTQRALESLDLLVTADIEMSATAQLADYVIATKLTLETAGMTYPVENLKFFGPGIGYTRPYAQYSSALVEPPEGSDVIEDWELFYGLCRRMEIDIHMVGFYGWGRHMESEMRFAAVDMNDKPSSEELLALMCEGSRVPLDEVKKYPHGHVFDDIEETVLPRDADCDVRLDIGNEHMMAELDEVAAEQYSLRHDVSEFPFRLIPRRSDAFLNSSGRSLRKLTKSRPFNPAFMHPDDVAALGLSDGDAIRIRSAHGEILGVVQGEAGLRRGLVSMTHAFGGVPASKENSPTGAEAQVRAVGSNTGRLVSAEVEYDPVSGMPRLGAIPVEVAAFA